MTENTKEKKNDSIVEGAFINFAPFDCKKMEKHMDIYNLQTEQEKRAFCNGWFSHCKSMVKNTPPTNL